MIGFNKPFLSGKEIEYISEAFKNLKVSGDGIFTKRCHTYFEQKYGFKKVLLTTSCTDALEMCAILLDIKPGDEIIAPSYTFVSTVNAFVLRGAKIIFADSYSDNPNIDADKIECLITSRTKAIVPVHYAGMACDMDKIMYLSEKYGLFVIEDAAQAIDSYYKGIPLGSIGHLSTFSFHETKNIISGEGGMIVINDDRFIERAEVIREKGTNRSKFFRGEVDKYGWVDIGSSFLPSEIIAACLFAQLEKMDLIQSKRKEIWDYYQDAFEGQLGKEISLPNIPGYAINNAHMYYLVFSSIEQRSRYINFMSENGVNVVFHYQSLHRSQFYMDKHDGRSLINSDKYTDCLVRLPLYFDLTEKEQNKIIELTLNFEQ
jgi:dTDP-4-amino-4,6-dideoxygalactose transaminase